MNDERSQEATGSRVELQGATSGGGRRGLVICGEQEDDRGNEYHDETDTTMRRMPR